jgi:hypothetical protein
MISVCFIDGEFWPKLSSPAGRDSKATRLLVLVHDGLAELWSIGNEETIPVEDPSLAAQ